MSPAVELLRTHGIEYIATRKGKYTTKCPNCGTGYLNVEVKQDGIVWYCHHCDQDGGEKYNNGVAVFSGELGEPKAIFDYRDEQRKRLYQVLRFEPIGKPKTFRQRTGPEQKKWSIKGIRVVVFMLAELLEAIENDRVVFVVEGERDVLTLRKHGIDATCNAMGAGKWRNQYAESFHGADVVLCGDNDDVGRNHMRTVAANLLPVVRCLRQLDLRTIWSEIEESDDISDWFERGGGTKEQLLEIIGTLPPLTAPPAPSGKRPKADAALELDDCFFRDFPGIPAKLQSVCAADVIMKGIDWAWPNRFARGKLGILAGLPDEGKGQMFCDIAARVTTGAEWPCNEGRAPLGNVVILTAEDAIDDTVVPRLVAAGADLKRVHFVKMVHEDGQDRMFSLISDLELLRQKIAEVGDVVLVQIDPISAYLGVGKVDSYRTTDVRAVLSPVKELAEELHIAILGIMHFNKKVDIVNVVLRISDSLAFGAAARHVYAVVDDPENKRKLIVKGKNNIAPRAEAEKVLAYYFGGREVGTDPKSGKTIWAPHIIWADKYVDVTATEAMQAATNNKTPAARDDAKKFLQDLLASGPVAVKDIEDAAKGNGIAWRTVERAKRDLGIVAKHDGPDGKWRWHPPMRPPHWTEGRQEGSETAKEGELAVLAAFEERQKEEGHRPCQWTKTANTANTPSIGGEAAKPAYEVVGSAPPGTRCIRCGKGGGVMRIKRGGAVDPWHMDCFGQYLEAMANTTFTLPDLGPDQLDEHGCPKPPSNRSK